MNFNNHKIVESIVAYRFKSSNDDWSLTNLLEFYKIIQSEGFTQKQEIKPFMVDFQVNFEEEIQQPPKYTYQDIQMSFDNPENKYSIILAKDYISFHNLGKYTGWENFLILVEKYYGKYQEMGLKKTVDSFQNYYVNHFEFNSGEELSKYFKFIPNIKDFTNGIETANIFQTNFEVHENLELFVKGIFKLDKKNNKKILRLECCSTYKLNDSVDKKNYSQETHDSIVNAFKAITTDALKEIIK